MWGKGKDTRSPGEGGEGSTDTVRSAPSLPGLSECLPTRALVGDSCGTLAGWACFMAKMQIIKSYLEPEYLTQEKLFPFPSSHKCFSNFLVLSAVDGCWD